MIFHREKLIVKVKFANSTMNSADFPESAIVPHSVDLYENSSSWEKKKKKILH